MLVNTCVENMRTLHLSQVPFPHALYLKEGGGIQITKLNKAEYYYIGTKWGETKKEVKKVKRNGCEAISQCENSQGLRKFSTLMKLQGLSAASSVLLLILPYAFWFSSSEFQLISSWSSWIPIFNIYSL